MKIKMEMKMMRIRVGAKRCPTGGIGWSGPGWTGLEKGWTAKRDSNEDWGVSSSSRLGKGCQEKGC